MVGVRGDVLRPPQDREGHNQKTMILATFEWNLSSYQMKAKREEYLMIYILFVRIKLLFKYV